MIVGRDNPSAGEGRSSWREALPQILAVCVKNVLLLGFGMTLGFPTILIPSLSGSDPKERISLGEEAISWIGSINLICVPVGCLMSGAITQPLGRKRAMQIVNIPFLTAWLIFHFASESWQIFLALAITGLTGGLLEAPVLTYVAEIAQPHLRGILSSTSSMAVMIGVLSQFLLGTFLPWRTVVLINCSLPVLSFFLLMYIPETPTWLISKNKLEEAKKSIAWLRGWVAVEHIEDEYQELRKQLGSTTTNTSPAATEDKSHGKLSFTKYAKLFTKKTFFWPYIVVSYTFFLSHFNGNTPLQIYAIKIFAVLNTPIDKYYATILLGIVQLLGCIICVSFVNYLGKRVINFISLLGSGICFIIVASYAYVANIMDLDIGSNETTNNTLQAVSPFVEEYSWMPTTFLVASAFLSALGIKILPWILTGEVYHSEIRATASGMSGGTGYIFGFISNKIFLSLISYFTLPGVFLFYGLIGLIGTLLLYYLLPETEGKALFEITEHFAGRSKLTNNVHRKKRKQINGQTNKGFVQDQANYRAESIF